MKLKRAIAKILNINSVAFKLCDIKDGCVQATFLIPTTVAEIVFNELNFLSKEQVKQLQDLAVLRLECNNSFVLTGDTNHNQKARKM